jgi:hypothetical protein
MQEMTTKLNNANNCHHFQDSHRFPLLTSIPLTSASVVDEHATSSRLIILSFCISFCIFCIWKLLEARGTNERARLEWPVFGREKLILKTMMFRDVTTVLTERKHLKMVIRSVLDSVSLVLDRTVSEPSTLVSLLYTALNKWTG